MQLVFGAAGAAIGAPFGMAGIGFSIGTGIYGLLQKPQKQVNSQPMMDLRIPGTQDGRCIPWLRGALRVAPDHAWHSNRRVIETTTTTEQGKGGGQEVENTTRTYEQDALYLLTINPGVGVIEVYDSGELIVRLDTGASAGTITASNASEHWDRMTVYTGDPAQLPDPDYEAWVDANVGAGQAPAYRGRITVFMKGIKLGTGGQPRQFEFVPVIDGSMSEQIWTSREMPENVGWFSLVFGNDRFVAIASDDNFAYSDDGVTWTPTTPPSGGGLNWRVGAYGAYDGGHRYIALSWFGAANNALWSDDGITWNLTSVAGALRGAVFGNARFVAVGDSSNTSISTDGGATWLNYTAPTNGGDIGVHLQSVAFGNGIFVAVGNTGSNQVVTSEDGAFWTQQVIPAASNWEAVCFADGQFVAVASGGSATQRVMTSPDGINWTLRTTPSIGGAAWLSVAWGNDLWVALSNATDDQSVMTSPDGITWTIETAAVGNRTWRGLAYGHNLFVATSSTSTNGERSMTRNAVSLVEVECPTVPDVQSGVFIRAGLTAGQIDVTPLAPITRTVCAFPWSQISAARVPSELLAGAYFYMITMSGQKIKCVPRGESEVATIPYADLGARLVGEGSDGDDPLPLRLVNDLEMPAQQAINFINLASNYQPGQELSDRLISATPVTVEPMEVPLGLQPGEAKGVIDTALRDRASALLRCRITVLRADYPTLEPTDAMIVVGKDGSQYRMRAEQMVDRFPLVDLDLVLDDPSVLIAQGITTTDYESQTTVTGPANTTLRLLDIPMLRDEDDAPILYAQAKGDRSSWHGAAVISSQNNVDYTRVATINEAAVFGTATSALGDYAGPRMIDFVSSVLVNVGDGTLTSSTRANVRASKAVNAFALGTDATGYEIGQFIDAELISASPNIYRLTRLYRGSRGTEWRMTGHVSGERFHLLRTEGMRVVTLPNAQIGASRYYKGVTLGRPDSSATAQTHTCNGVSLMPFSPSRVRVSRDSSNNATIVVTRRTRMGTRFTGPLGVSVPLGEQTEGYSIDIYSDGTYTTVVDTLSVIGTNTVEYTAAAQTSAGLTPGDPLNMRVRMLSAIVGLGYPLQRAA